jgi:hypothetical protein
MIGAYPGPRQPRVRDRGDGLERSLAKAGAAERGSGATDRLARTSRDLTAGREPAAESWLDHSCDGSGSYQSAIVTPRRRGSRSSRCSLASLE